VQGGLAAMIEGVSTQRFRSRHCGPCGHGEKEYACGYDFLNLVKGHHRFVG
jgi:hypothetical protein